MVANTAIRSVEMDIPEASRGRLRGRSRGRARRPAEQTPITPGGPVLDGRGDEPQTRSECLARDLKTLSINPSGGDQKRDTVINTNTKGNFRGRKPLSTQQVFTRPKNVISKQGKTGDVVELSANYFALLTHTDWALYQYRVDFSPEEERTVTRKALLRMHKDSLGGGYIFDGTVLFVTQLLSPGPIELYSIRESDQEKIRITIKKAGDLVMGDHHYIQLFNILMRKCLDNLHLQMVGRNFFDAAARVEIKEYKMELWPGYLTSIRQHENNILMCAEITHKVMRRETALDLMYESMNRSRQDWKSVFENSIIGSVVLTEYNNRTYRIDDIDFNTRPDSTFQLRNKEERTYIDYYLQRYEIRIRVKDQPMLVSRAKPREIRAGMTEIIYLVPELCRLTGLTDDMRSNFQLMRALAEHTRVVPEARIQKLHKFSSRLKSTPSVQEDLTQWNMKLSTDLVKFNGRILPHEVITYGGSAHSDAGRDADWTKSMRNFPMLIMGTLRNWAICYMSKSKPDVQSFIAALTKSAITLQFTIPQPIIKELNDDRSSTYVDAIDQLISYKNPQLIMCIVPNNRADRYGAIKKKCCVDRAVPTQVVVAKNLVSKGIMSITTKIAIQINCKIGGTPWTVSVPMNGLMVVGYDVCHDTTNKGRSFGAMVASLNKGLSRYYSAATPHTSGEELSNDLSINIVKAVVKYRQYNQDNLPSRVVIYRDGVGEGQIPFVFNHEVRVIKEKLNNIYNGKPPGMAFIIVTKRLNTRIFYENRNPPPGTIVDDCITSPDKYDFFLVSQSVRQGTVSPTAYNVIDDSTGLDPDKMQRLTYKMTHLYFNWSGTVRVPAQCQYAHKLAFLVGQSLHRSPNNGLEDLLYFL
ncbi:piwi-like protein Siwi isoform X3 [Cimex lectularius]|uniref:Piwi n=2 Tax=Cimex lectularius TaxID=79782 RepID=A0A8I6S6D0_CIMLE|nr:piwi-like protein Siwi isoform X3 [Cimex lectularius]